MNLYQVQARYQQLLDQDEYNAEECAELASIHADIEDACIERAKYIRNLEAEAAAIDIAIKEMKERQSALNTKSDIQTNKLISIMQDNKIVSIKKSPLFTIQLSTNPPMVDDYDKSKIPEKFWITKTTETKSINKIAIKEAILSGETVDGTALIRKVRVDFK